VSRFCEPGARWRVVAYGPALCLTVAVSEVLGHWRVHAVALGGLAVLLAGIGALQVAAARAHVSVALDETTLRSGAQTLPLADIAEIFPDSDDEQPWHSARALGEVHGVPRRRTGIGLRLRDGRLVQAWARDHRRLRAELMRAVQEVE
jgi:hypothetical protein